MSIRFKGKETRRNKNIWSTCSRREKKKNIGKSTSFRERKLRPKKEK